MPEYEETLNFNARSKWFDPNDFVMAEYQETLTFKSRSKVEFLSGFEYEENLAFNARSKVDFSIFNLTQWAEENRGRVVTFYACQIVDIKSGMPLYDLRMENFQGRMRRDTPDYISTTIPDVTLFNQVDQAAQNGAYLVIFMAEYVNNEISFQQEIARVNLERPRTDRGGRSQSMTLFGYRTSSESSQVVDLPPPTISRVVNGALQMAFAKPNLFLRAGDTAQVEGFAPFQVETISYTVSVERSIMNISQAVV